jgi:Tfp pilus assembly protein PilE
MRSKQSGFTIVELFGVIIPLAIIITLGTIAVHFLHKYW